ncbi:GGDEF domain-containing protein [uncultured Salinisphaera sp.]|uniref:GGDEF domain-containing protein n=1 Tax=uncultured Salinisphaera sp. TaxID=359372 RepID=UPI0032B1E99B
MTSLTNEYYSLSARAAGTPAALSDTPPTRLLQRQIDRGFRQLRFMPELEPAFQAYLRVSGQFSRASLIVFAVLGVLVSALIDVAWLNLPHELWLPTRLIQFGAMVPMGLICIFLCLRHSASRAMDVGTLLLFVTVSAGLLAQRVVDSQLGFELPLELVGVSAVAMLCLSRVPFWSQMPTLLVVALITVWVELTAVTRLSSSHYDLFATGLLFLAALVAGYASEYTIRWTWLNATLLQYLSRLDRLTGLLNRHALEDQLEDGQAHARREQLDYALVMVDVDAFGAYNNHYGHQCGDRALQRVADVLAEHARRPMDVCGRYGGEEFVLMWMDCDAHNARTMATALCEAIEKERIEHHCSPAGKHVTASVGLCHVSAAYAHTSLDSVLREADRMLYAAKSAGRNRMCYSCYDDKARPFQSP